MFGQRSWNPYGRLFFSPDDDSGGSGGGNEKPTEEKPADPLAGLTAEQRTLIQKQIDAAASAARKSGEKDGLTKAQTDANAKAESERVAKEQADAIKAGEFDTAKSLIEKERDDAKAESQARADKLERANTVLASVLAERIKILEATGDKDLIAAFPKDAEPLDQLDWLNDPRTKAALAKAKEADDVEKAKANPRVITPRPNGTGKPDEVKSLVNARSF